jgi:hypothetical protein
MSLDVVLTPVYSAVGVSYHYMLNSRGMEDKGRLKELFLLQVVQTGSGAHPALGAVFPVCEESRA